MKYFKLRPGNSQKKPLKLTLKIRSDEMFDPMIIAPHNEINDSVFAHIDRFTQRTKLGSSLSIAIYTDNTSPIIQEKFRELFVEHYDDDLKTARNSLNTRYILTFLFILLSAINIAFWNHLRGKVMLNLFQNIWAFMLWKIGDTFIDGVNKWRNYKRIESIKRAEIHFYRIKENKHFIQEAKA